jgi:hypothetical protein
LFEDARVVFYPEPAEVETSFRKHSATAASSPKVWADAWLTSLTPPRTT